MQLLTDPDSELRGKIFPPSSSVFPSSRQGRTLFGGDEAERMVGLRTRALLEAVQRPEEMPSFAESLEIQSRWKLDGEMRSMTVGLSDSHPTLCMVRGRAKPVLRGQNSTEPNLIHHRETTYRVG